MVCIRDVNKARILEAEARTLEAEAQDPRGLGRGQDPRVEGEARTLEAKAVAKAEFIQFWPSEL